MELGLLTKWAVLICQQVLSIQNNQVGRKKRFFGPGSNISDDFWKLSIGTTKKDMAEMKDLFNLFDIDGNGSITQELFNDQSKK